MGCSLGFILNPRGGFYRQILSRGRKPHLQLVPAVAVAVQPALSQSWAIGSALPGDLRLTRSAGLLGFSRELLVLWVEARGCHKVSCHQESACLAYLTISSAQAKGWFTGWKLHSCQKQFVP